MTINHTPGPWLVTDETNPLIYSDAYTGTHVAQVFAYTDGTTGTSRPQADADARLIAAAPELLQALKYLLANPGYHIAEGRARAAIAKATGASGD